MPGWRGKKKRNASAIGRSVRGRGRGGGRGGEGRQTSWRNDGREREKDRTAGTMEEGVRGGKRDIRARGSRTKRMGREGKQEGKRWEGSHEWRQPGEGDRGDKSRESEREGDIGGGRGPAEFRARYAIWRYRGQRLVRNTKLFMNGRKLSLKL